MHALPQLNMWRTAVFLAAMLQLFPAERTCYDDDPRPFPGANLLRMIGDVAQSSEG